MGRDVNAGRIQQLAKVGKRYERQKFAGIVPVKSRQPPFLLTGCPFRGGLITKAPSRGSHEATGFAGGASLLMS